MKMMESILVLLIFFFLVVFGLIFYTKFSQVSLSKKSDEKMSLQALQASQRIQHMPELRCTKDGTQVEGDCFDLLKLKAFSKMLKSGIGSQIYSKYFPNIEIEVSLIYPMDNARNWTVYNTTMNSSLNKELFFLPVTLHNVTEGEYYFGYLTVGVFY